MCANYTPVKDPLRLKRYFGVGNHPAFPEETWSGYVAPFILQSQDQAIHERALAVGIFGLVPHWVKELTIALDAVRPIEAVKMNYGRRSCGWHAGYGRAGIGRISARGR